jgi:DNA invertase Pin-like site-specific DNA recombinase
MSGRADYPREIQDYGNRQGWQIVETYHGTISGAKVSRPGRNRLMADAMARKFQCLLVWKLTLVTQSGAVGLVRLYIREGPGLPSCLRSSSFSRSSSRMR